jgi:glycosyltransferase involved in cell wall biosynthesis
MGLRIVTYANAPCVPTGFGTVMRELFTGLVERRQVPIDDLNFFGINYLGDPHGMPFKIWPAQVAASRDPDLFGRVRFCQKLLSNEIPFNVLFLLEDSFTLTHPIPFNNQLQPFMPALIQALRQQCREGRPPFLVVQYLPIDGDHVRPEWLTWMSSCVDYPVAYTQYGHRVMTDTVPMLRERLRVIPHGTNPATFFPVPPEERVRFRCEQLRLQPGQPLLVNVNRNQPRKDVPKTLQVFREVLKVHPDAKLYLHMNRADAAGFDLARIQHQLRIPQDAVLFPLNFSEGVGVPLPILNMIYNAADVLLTTCRGGGWELPVSEAMTVGIPVVAPDHTSLSELLADNRGVLVPPLEHRDVMLSDNDQLRPVANVRDMAAAVCDLLAHPERAREMGRRGREWAQGLTWRHHVVPQWEAIFQHCVTRLEAPASTTAPPYQMNGVRIAA